MLNVSNKDFLSAIFGDEWGKAHVTAFEQDPTNIEEQDERMRCWGGGSAKSRLSRFSPLSNQYFTISLFNPDNEGIARRRKKLFDACFVIVADDVAEKLPVDRVELLPPPSFKMFTSAGSEQWGWILESPEESDDKVNNLLDGLIEKGLSPSGVDSGMKGVTRYVRLPEGSNTKAKRFVDGKPFKCYLSEWHPERLHNIDTLADTFEIDLSAARADNNALAVNSASPIYSKHPIWSHVTVTGVNGEWTQIDCPNVDRHSDDDASGAALIIRDNGSVGFQCHHGSCNGDKDVPKFTGMDICELLGIRQEVADYVLSVGIEAGNALADSLGREINTAKETQKEEELILRDDDNFNLLRYVYIPSANKFYDVCTGDTVAGEALDRLYLRTMPGGKEHDLATKYFHINRCAELNIADGIGWVPWSNKKPSRDELIVDFSNRRLVNSWGGLKIKAIEGDCTPWLEHVSYLLPVEEQRDNIINYLAFMLQQPQTKPAYTILHRGSQGVGKDLMLMPPVRALGHEASGSVTVDQLVKGWGDYMARKKFLIIEEVDKAQNRSVNNALKTVLAPTATGVRTLNLKGGEVVTQMDCLTTYMMSNKKNPITLEKDDRRYYVVDSFIETKESSYYTKLLNWLNDGGIANVIHYLLNVDLSDFNPNTPPSITAGMLEMQDAGRYDYEITIEEMVNEKKAPFMMNIFTLTTLKKAVKEHGVLCITNSLIEAVESCGFTMLRGTKKVDGSVCNSPKYFVLNAVAETLTTRKEQFDYWEKYQSAGG